MHKPKIVFAQEYIDGRNGTNPKRDSKEYHHYYLDVIQSVLNGRYYLESRRYEEYIKNIKSIENETNKTKSI